MYLGDGCISMHRRGVARLRIHLDLKYPGIVNECKQAIADHFPRNSVHLQPMSSHYTGKPAMTSVVVSSYSKAWTCLLPQHGPGRKHLRKIGLESWQTDLVEAQPGLFLRGLIHSDGCRFINTGRNWKHPRYGFSNRSDDIRRIFEDTCAVLGVHTTRATYTVYVSRKTDVAVLDRQIGPKY